MKHKFSLASLLLLFCATSLWASGTEVDGIWYDFSNSTMTASVTYSGSNAPNKYTNDVSIPESVTFNGNTYNVTSIGDRAFYHCYELTSIMIPNSITSIGSSAFSGCLGITDVIIPSSVTEIGEDVFFNCSGLTSVTIPNNISSIGYRAFSGCSSLTNVTIPDNVTIIGNSAFYGCRNLTSMAIPNSVTSIGSSAFSGCSSLTSITIPSSVIEIGESAFSGCPNLPVENNIRYADTYLVDVTDKSLSYYIIKEGTRFIGNSAFAKCSNMTSISIPNSVICIGNNAFSGCIKLPVENNIRYADTYLIEAVDKNLSTYIIKEGTRFIGNSAFYKSSSLTSIDIPNSVTIIGHSAFASCPMLEKVTIGNSVMSIGDSGFRNCTGLTNIEIPNSVTSVGNCVFQECAKLINVTIGNNVTSIGEKVFWSCSSLTSIKIPDSVMSIGTSAFEGCSNLTSVIIPNGVKSIGKEAFRNCTALMNATIGKRVTNIGDRVFNGCRELTSITVDATNPNFDSRDNCNAIIETSTNTLVTSCKSTFIPNSVTRIGDYAFYECPGLTNITIPNSVICIGEEAFANVGLTSITIPNSIKTIEDRAFFLCSYLKHVTIGSGLTELGNSAFAECPILADINVATDNNTFCSKEGVLFTKDLSILVLFPNGKQGRYAIPNNVIRIGDGAFSGCTGLTNVEIGSRIDSIGQGAFQDCINITKVVIPNRVTSIGMNAFSGCSSIATITCEAITPPTCGWNAFSNKLIPLYVPVNSVDAYKNAIIWKDFTNIQPIQASETEVANIDVKPMESSVIIEWSRNDEAATYTIVIKKGDEVICTLTFNEIGQLTTISYAPSRSGNTNQQRSALQTSTGWQYTISGLDANTEYSYTVIAQKSDDTVVYNKSVVFTTLHTTDLESILTSKISCQKIIHNGQLLILRDGKTYTMQGIEVK